MIRVEVVTERGRIFDVSVGNVPAVFEARRVENLQKRFESRKRALEGIVNGVCNELLCRPLDEFYEIFVTVPSIMNSRKFIIQDNGTTEHDQNQPEESADSKE